MYHHMLTPYGVTPFPEYRSVAPVSAILHCIRREDNEAVLWHLQKYQVMTFVVKR